MTDETMKERLTRSAFELFSAQGFREVSLDAVAAHAGVTKGAIYSNYQSKKELILDTCQYYYRLWDERMAVLCYTDRDPVGRLRQALLLSTEQCLFSATNRLFTSEIFAMAIQDEDIRRSWSAFFDHNRDFYTSLIRAIVEKEKRNIAFPERNAEWLLSAFEGLKQRALFEPALAELGQMGTVVEHLMEIAIAENT